MGARRLTLVIALGALVVCFMVAGCGGPQQATEAEWKAIRDTEGLRQAEFSRRIAEQDAQNIEAHRLEDEQEEKALREARAEGSVAQLRVFVGSEAQTGQQQLGFADQATVKRVLASAGFNLAATRNECDLFVNVISHSVYTVNRERIHAVKATVTAMTSGAATMALTPCVWKPERELTRDHVTGTWYTSGTQRFPVVPDDGCSVVKPTTDAADAIAIRLAKALATSKDAAAYADLVLQSRGGAPSMGVASTAGLSSPAGPGSPPHRPADTLVAATPQPSSFALVVGIDHYRDIGVDALGAKADAERFADLARRTLGLKSENVRLAIGDRATKSDIVKQLDWLVGNVPAGGRIYFYFSGHGAPDPVQGTPYIVPYDGDASSLAASAIPLGEVLDKLAASKAKDVVLFMDSCFSGSGGRSVIPKGTRPLVRVVDAQIPSQVTVLSASASDEISGTTTDSAAGLFTNHLLEGLGRGSADLDGDGQISMDELHHWIGPRVSRDAQAQNRKQTPSLSVGAGLSAAGVPVAWGYARP